MTLLKMVYAPDTRLKAQCSKIIQITDELRKLADNMLETMYQQRGIGLAAPQIGETIRLFVMDCQQKQPDTTSDDEIQINLPGQPYKLFNPVITEFSEEMDEFEEGCLSLPSIMQKVSRPKKVTVEYLDEQGQKQKLVADGISAICIQHEIDHLNGKLLIDYMGPVKRQMTLKKLQKWKNENVK